MGKTAWRILQLLWAAAILYALVNALADARRILILHRRGGGPDEQAVQASARWLSGLPADSRLLLLLSHRDLGPVWFRQRLSYFVYPRRLDIAWDAPPTDASAQYDYGLAYNSAQSAPPVGWTPLARSSLATLYAPAAGRPPPAASESALTAYASPARLLAGVFSLGATLALGLLLLGWTVPKPTFTAWWGNLALAHLVGAAALAWLTTLTSLLLGRLSVWPVYLVLLLLLPGWRRVRLSGPMKDPSSGPAANHCTALSDSSTVRERAARPPDGMHDTILWVGAALTLILLGLMMAATRGGFFGLDWDGFAIWQLKGKAFFLDGDFSLLQDAIHFDYAHRDYPLLVPLQTWWTYAHIGVAADRWAQVINVLFTLDLLALFAAFAGRYVSRPILLVGLALLASLPVLAAHAVSGFADVPLAAYLLALGICLAGLLVEKERSFLPLLAWLFVGVVLVKNEGLLACMSGLLVAAFYLARSRKAIVGSPEEKRQPDMRALLLWAGAAALAYLPWMVLKRAWHLSTDLFDRQAPLHFTSSLLLWRLGYALRGFARELARAGPWYPCWGLLIALFPAGLAASLRRRVAVSGPLWLLAGLQFLGYTGIYLITPYALPGHMATSVDRLTLHLVPVLLLAALLGSFAPAASPTPRPLQTRF